MAKLLRGWVCCLGKQRKHIVVLRLESLLHELLVARRGDVRRRMGDGRVGLDNVLARACGHGVAALLEILGSRILGWTWRCAKLLDRTVDERLDALHDLQDPRMRTIPRN